jgi:hypothetical protein
VAAQELLAVQTTEWYNQMERGITKWSVVLPNGVFLCPRIAENTTAVRPACFLTHAGPAPLLPTRRLLLPSADANALTTLTLAATALALEAATLAWQRQRGRQNQLLRGECWNVVPTAECFAHVGVRVTPLQWCCLAESVHQSKYTVFVVDVVMRLLDVFVLHGGCGGALSRHRRLDFSGAVERTTNDARGGARGT